jgi:capsular polysaccharide transport system ATP-binding protein
MIVLKQVTQTLTLGDTTKNTLVSVNLSIPTNRRIALLGSTEETRPFLDLLGGVQLPAKGHIVRKATVSFPVGYTGSFSPSLSVRFNVAHTARLYGADVQAVVNFVATAASLGRAYEEPFSDLPKEMRLRLGQVLGYSIPFDVYLLHMEPTRREVREFLPLYEARARTSGMIVATRYLEFAEKQCESVLIQHCGKLLIYDSPEKAILKFNELKADS